MASLIYEIYNPKTKDCPVASAIHNAYQSESNAVSIVLNERCGEGWFKRHRLNHCMELSQFEFSFNRTITMASSQVRDFGELTFCTGDALSWTPQSANNDCFIEKGRWGYFNHELSEGCCDYEKGHTYSGLGIKVTESSFERELSELLERPVALKSLLGPSKAFPMSLNKVISEMALNPYSGRLELLYAEAKTLELLSIFASECLREKPQRKSQNLSRTDQDLLCDVKALLDSRLETPPTIEALSKHAAMNSQKLKLGFNQMFGTSIHQYIIAERMKKAKAMLICQENSLSILEISLAVGYKDPAYFSRQFKRHYGLLPSEFKQDYQ